MKLKYNQDMVKSEEEHLQLRLKILRDHMKALLHDVKVILNRIEQIVKSEN